MSWMRTRARSTWPANSAKAAPSPLSCPCGRGRKPMNTDRGARILVIEDELPMRTALQDCLESEGYRVLSASDGQVGLARALKEKPDLILLDIMLPRLDGFALCAELRGKGQTVPVLMLTAKGF